MCKQKIELRKHKDILDNLQIVSHKSIDVLNGNGEDHSQGSMASAINVLVEVVSIVKRLSAFEDFVPEIFEKNFFQDLIEILSTNRPYLINVFLEFLYFLCDAIK